MTCTESGVTILSVNADDGGATVRATNAHADKVLQCYVNGDLVAMQAAPAATWQCRLAPLGDTDVLFVLAVDLDQANENLWAAAFADTAAGNRIHVRLPQTIAPYRPTDRWRIYRGRPGDASAAIEAHTGWIYPGGRRACGFGAGFDAAFGYDAADAVGFGYTFGRGEFAFDCRLLQWRSDPLAAGTYPLRVTVLDAAGNESPATETTVTLATYARAARDLAATGFDRSTETLTFTFTPSEDLPHG